MDPNHGNLVIVAQTPDQMIAKVTRFDMTNIGNAFLIPTAGYSVGSIHVVDGSAAALSTGVLTVIVSNDPDGQHFVAHPDVAGTFSAAGTATGFALEHAYVGLRVTTAQAISVDVFICLKA